MLDSKIVTNLEKLARKFTNRTFRKPTMEDQSIILLAMLAGAELALRPEVPVDLESMMKDLDPGEMRVL